MWIERLMAGISHQHVLSYNPKIMSAEASIISESPRHGTTIEFEHLYLSHLSFNFTGGNFFAAGEMLASVKIDKENR